MITNGKSKILSVLGALALVLSATHAIAFAKNINSYKSSILEFGEANARYHGLAGGDITEISPFGGYLTGVIPFGGNPSASNPSASNPSASNPSASNPSASNPSASNPSADNLSADNSSAGNSYSSSSNDFYGVQGGGSEASASISAANGNPFIGAANMNLLISKAKNDKKDYVSTNSSGLYGISKEALALLSGFAFRHDTIAGNIVQVRVVIVNPAAIKDDILLSAYASGKDAEQIKDFFKKWFNNEFAVVSFDQTGTWNQSVKIAAKTDLSGLDTENLIFYSYNKRLNRYKRIGVPEYRLDANGYLHFVTELADYIIITDSELESK